MARVNPRKVGNIPAFFFFFFFFFWCQILTCLVEELNEEDQQLKGELEMLVERLKVRVLFWRLVLSGTGLR